MFCSTYSAYDITSKSIYEKTGCCLNVILFSHLLLAVLQCPKVQQKATATIQNNGALVWEALSIICDKGYGINRVKPFVNISCLPNQEYETNVTDIKCESKEIYLRFHVAINKQVIKTYILQSSLQCSHFNKVFSIHFKMYTMNMYI